MESETLARLRNDLTELVRRYGHERREEPFQLSSAGLSYDYVDGKQATSTGPRLRLVARAVGEITRAAGIDFDAVGGPTVGADAMTVAIAVELEKQWFFVRKAPKAHGKQKLIEGAVMEPGTRAIIVDDVATSGTSILQAIDAVREIGAEVVMVLPMVDRGEMTRPKIEALGIAYEPVLTYKDIGIDPVG